MAYRVVDLFAGVGGLSYGFADDDDFILLAANEILKPMADAYAMNHPNVRIYNKDIKDFSLQDLYDDFQLERGEVDVVVGGPPCQAYSTVGKRSENDPRGQLFQEYYRVINELYPRIFIFENVKGLLSMKKGALIKEIISLFASLGYSIQMRVLNAADYGTPQIRERVVLVGTRGQRLFVYPQPTHYNPDEQPLNVEDLLPYVTLSEALGDLPPVVWGQQGANYITEPQTEYQVKMRERGGIEPVDHYASRHNEQLQALMKALPDGGTPRDLAEHLRPKSGFPNSYSKLWWDKPSTTITRNFSCPSSARCIHPRDARPLTIREGARLQGFPDDYVFCGSKADKVLQIGNAVPTFLSIALKNSVKAYLDAEEMLLNR